LSWQAEAMENSGSPPKTSWSGSEVVLVRAVRRGRAGKVMTHLHFTFGPVQSFVGAGKTPRRDLYAGSFLLSYLGVGKRWRRAEAKRHFCPTTLVSKSWLMRRVSSTPFAPNRFIAEFADEATAVEAGTGLVTH